MVYKKIVGGIFFFVYSLVGYAQSINNLIAQSEKIKIEKGEKSQEYLTMLDSIVQVANRAEKLEICYEYREKHMEIVKKIYGEQSAEYADDLIRLCNTDVRINQNYSSKVVEDYEKAVAIINKENRYVNVYAYIGALQTLGTVYYSMGNYGKALEYYEQALKILKKVLGETHPVYTRSLNDIGVVYTYMGNYGKALEYYEQASKIQKKVLGETHPDYATSLNNIGVFYADMGNDGKALEYYEQASRIRKQVLGENHPHYATSLNNIGVVYRSMGNYGKALEYYEQALQIRKQVLGENHPDYATSLNNIGIVYADMGNYGKALEYYEQALKIQKQALGENHPEYAGFLNNIGNVYADMGNYGKALEYYEQALKIPKQALGENHPEYAGFLNNIGNVYADMGNYGKAMEYYEQALKIKKQVLGETHPDYATSLNNIGNVYSDMGNYGKALEYYEQALKIRKQVLGETHPDYAFSLYNTGSVYDDMGNYRDASNYWCLSFQIERKKLHENFRSLTEKERELYWEKNKDVFIDVVRLNYNLPNDAITTQTSFDAELLKKGLLLTSEIEFQKVIQESGDSSLVAEFEKLRTIRCWLNKLYEKPIAERAVNCDSLERVAEQLEKHLVANCKEYGDMTRSISLTWQDVRSALKPNEVAIEFSNFELDKDSTMYVALVLTNTMESPEYVPLFEKAEFDKRMEESKTKLFESDSTRGVMDSYRKQMGAYETTELYDMVWKPLEKYLTDNSKIYFAPSGLLHQIGIEYALTEKGKTMSDTYEMYRVSSTKNLAMGYEPKAWTNASMYGGIEYDCDTTQMKSESGNRRGYDETYNSTATYNSFATLNRATTTHKAIKYLPGTKAEVEEIKVCLDKKNIGTTLYEGTTASEESFKSLSGTNVPILHIATHGFYIDADTSKYKFDISMQQTGLMFAGSNLAWTNQPLPEGVEDGILTAKEISHVDLRKTDLVVLSACQTGLGEVTGEGVYGLQRGFKKAGAKTIVMSLWSVDDFATKLMMTEFYTHLAEGKPKREAFNLAQAKVRATYDDPYYWAGFIMLD